MLGYISNFSTELSAIVCLAFSIVFAKEVKIHLQVATKDGSIHKNMETEVQIEKNKILYDGILTDE